MKKARLLLSCLTAAAVLTGLAGFTGCDKLGNLSPFKKKEAESAPAAEAAADPAAAGETGSKGAEAATAEASAKTAAKTAAAPTPKPTPEKEEINRNAGVIVLCYHRFEEKNPDNLAITPTEFEQQLQALKDNGIEVISMQDFLAWRRGEKNIPEKSCIITIDDGYDSSYTHAWPILKKFGYPFTMFVYMDYIGIGGKSITWDQLAAMRDEGVDIQSHTWSHQSLRGKGNVNKKNREEIQRIGYEAWLEKEIAGSKKALEERLGIRVNALAYPYGIHNEEARAMITKSGYEVAFTVYGQRNGFDAPVAEQIGRYAIGSKEPEIFQAALRAIGSAAPAGASAPSIAQLASASMVTQPMNGETISNPHPTLKANLSTMGEIEPDSVEMRISGFGLVPAEYDATSKTVSYTLANQPLRDKNYTVIIGARVGGKKVETRWSFNFDPSAAATPAAQ